MAADRGRSTLSAFFGWAIGEGIAEVNPVIGTNKSSKGASRERVLTDAELVAIWNAAPASDYGRIVRLLMLTGQRRDEIADLRLRAEIEDGQIALSGGANQEQPASMTFRCRHRPRPCWTRCGARWAGLRVRPTGKGGFSGFSKAKERLDEASGVSELDAARPAPHGGNPHGRSRRAASRHRGDPEPRLRPQGRRGRHL